MIVAIVADGDESDKHKIFKLVAKDFIQFIPNESQKGWILDIENKRQNTHKCS